MTGMAACGAHCSLVASGRITACPAVPSRSSPSQGSSPSPRVAYLSAQGFNGGKPDNISFDAKKNPVSVNNGFFDRCTAGATIGCEQGATPGTASCPGGADELAGTGFGVLGSYCPGGGGQSVSGGATGWLSSQAPVKAGETFTLDLMIWDTGDGELDSSVLLDNFQWVAGEVVTSTERPGPR